MNHTQDVSINGPGSPASLKKLIKYVVDPNAKGPVVFIDNGVGIVKDDPDTIVITPEDCKQQALYFLEKFFKPLQKPPYYVIRHLLALYERPGCEYDYSHSGKAKYPDNESVKMATMTGGIKAEDEDYKFLINKFTYGEHDPEFLQLLGLIQLASGAVKSGGRVFIDYPETFLHPKRERMVMTMLEEIKRDATGGK
jgi:hypothetical protein